MLFPPLINTRHLETLIDNPHNDIYHMTHQIDTSIILEFGGLKKNYGNSGRALMRENTVQIFSRPELLEICTVLDPSFSSPGS